MYEVEQVVGKRLNPQTNTFEYRVKWVNYPPEDNTWEPQRNLKFVKNLIEDFNKRCEMKGDLGIQTGMEAKQRTNQTEGGKGITRPMIYTVNEDSDQGKLDNGNLFFEQESDQEGQQLQPKQPQEQKKEQKKQEKQVETIKDEPKPITTAPTEPLSSLQPPPKPTISQLPKPISQFPVKASSIQSSSMEIKTKQPEKQNILQKIQMNKKVPLLPPDFSINKDRYILPNQAKQKNITKTKVIQKNRQRGYPTKEYQFQPMKPNKVKEDIIKKMNIVKPMSRVIPPPPPPSYSSSQPIFQQNYFSNQYQVYNSIPDYPQVQPSTITTKPYKQHLPSSSLSANIYQPPLLTSQAPNYQYQVQRKKNNFSSNVSSFMPDHSDYMYLPESEIRLDDENNGYQCEGLGKLDVFEVVSMQKTMDGFMYLVETSQGRKWVHRKELLPQFCMLVLQFYEKHLTFQN